ncbi:hypothetical protein ES707_07065 [subsurface metagenome]
MNWTAFVANIASKIPIERVLFPPRDSAKSLENFAATIRSPTSPKTAPVSENIASTITAEREEAAPVPAPAARHDLPTSEETSRELKRRLGKELYRAELDLSNKLRIAGKPCDCLDSKHTLGLEAAAEELIAQEPDSTVYPEIIDWIKRNLPKLGIEAIVSGQYDEEYPRMAAEFKGFRKRIMGTTVLTAMVAPKEQMPLEEAKQRSMNKGNCPHCGGPLDKDGCCPKCQICPLPKPQK